MALLALTWVPTAMAAVPAAPQPPHAVGRIDVAYELRFWFVPFGHTEYHAIFDKGIYQATSHFSTSGFVSVFWQAQINAGVSGRLAQSTLAPFIYDSYARRSADKIQQVKLSFHQYGPPTLLANPPYNTKRYPVSVQEQEKGIDPMSAIGAILTGLSTTPQQPCGTVVRVFDGRRRYNIAFTYLRDEKQVPHAPLQTDMLHICALHYRQIAGYKPNLLRGKNRWPSIYARIVDIVAPSAPLGRYVIPVELWADTDWGRVSASLTGLSINGEHLVLR